MESLSLEEENIIKDIRNFFRTFSKKLNCTAIKNTRNLFKIEKKLKQFIKLSHN